MFVLFLFALAWAEKHPAFTWQKCTKSGGCTSQTGYIVHDRHIEGGSWYRDQLDGKSASRDLDYENEVGVITNGGTLSQRLISKMDNSQITGSRIYLLASDDKNYEKFNFVGKELTYTVNLSEIPCGVNAAFYTVEMPANGVDSTDTNQGAAWGYGYCDANCVDGGCCPEFDVQEASSKALVFTTHNCQNVQPSQRGGYGGCDTSGCGYNPYRDSNQHSFWTSSVNLAQPITVVTQFKGSGSSITSVDRKYVVGGRTVDGGTLDQSRCNGGQNMGATFAKGHVLVFSLWASDGMSWMDGGNAGPCTSYNVNNIKNSQPNLKVTWSNVKFGDIDSTY